MTSTKSSLLSNKAFDKLKFIAQILLPAATSAYFGLAQVWSLPHTEQIVGTATVVDTFLGVVLGLSTVNYNKNDGAPLGDLLVHEDEDGKHLALVANPAVMSNIDSKGTVKFNVVSQPAPPSE